MDTNDFGFLIEQKHSDADRLQGLNERWKPKTKEEFPKSYHDRNGKMKPRSITADLLEKYPWLAISMHSKYKGAWCSYCVLFDTSLEAGGQKLGKLVSSPLTDYSKLTGKNGLLSNHELKHYHTTNKTRALEFLSHLNSEKNVASLVNSHHKEQIIRNRAALSSIIETLKFAAIQNISLRGHRDSGRIDSLGDYPSENDGNFRMLLRFRLKSGDNDLKNHLSDASPAMLYTSPLIQNEILTDICTLMKKSLVERIKESFVWAIMADETTDSSNREQMAIVARYISNKEGKFIVREDPICLIDVFDSIKSNEDSDEIRMTGKNMAKVILEKIKSLNLNPSKLVAQSYDGAASMSSERIGVTAYVKEVAPHAFYFHCAVHALNLGTSQVNRVEAIRNALGTMESIIVFITDGAKRDNLLKIVQKENESVKNKLIKLCQTRFVERHVAVDRFFSQIETIKQTLSLLTKWQDRKTSSMANNFLNAMQKTDFILGLVVMNRISSILRPLSLQLQSKDADLVKALELVEAVQKALRDEREKFGEIFEEAEEIAEKLEVELQLPRIVKRSTCRSNAGNGMDIIKHYRINVFNPAIDNVLQDLESRFQSHHKQSLNLTLMLPKKCKESNGEETESLEALYNLYKPFLMTSLSEFKADYKV